MTPTKRARLHLEAGRPIPGDMVPVHGGTDVYDGPSHPTKRVALLNSPRVLVIALDEFLEHMLIMTRSGRTIGWISVGDQDERQVWRP